jgi:hypothetical protein
MSEVRVIYIHETKILAKLRSNFFNFLNCLIRSLTVFRIIKVNESQKHWLSEQLINFIALISQFIDFFHCIFVNPKMKISICFRCNIEMYKISVISFQNKAAHSNRLKPLNSMLKFHLFNHFLIINNTNSQIFSYS